LRTDGVVWRAIGRGTGRLLALMAVVVVLALAMPEIVRMMTPTRLAVAHTVIAQIWWPATALRLLVYALLAWGVYPVWVQARLGAVEAALEDEPPAGGDPRADERRVALAARRAHLCRAAGRQWGVFGGLMGVELLIAQCPYGLFGG